MYAVLEYLAVVGIVWFLFLVLFAALAFWIVLTEGIKWLANFCDQILTRLVVRMRSAVDIAWARAGIRDKLSSARIVAGRPDHKRGWCSEQGHMAHAVRQFMAGHGLFRS